MSGRFTAQDRHHWKSKATNTGAHTVIKGEHINKVQATEDKSYGLIKNQQ